MVTSQDVADFYIDLFRNSDDPMTRMRLSKFLYFAQGWSMVRFGRPLFSDEFKAFHHGPVLTSLDSGLRKSGAIPLRKKMSRQTLDAFTPEQAELLLDVAEKYNRFSTRELSVLTHRKGGAWAKYHVEGQTAPQVIPLESIREEFERIKAGEGDLPDFFAEEAKRQHSNMPLSSIDQELPDDFDE